MLSRRRSFAGVGAVQRRRGRSDDHAESESADRHGFAGPDCQRCCGAGVRLAARLDRRRGSGVLFKMGLICNFEFRAFFTAWQSAVIPPQYPVDGIGDTWFTGQYRVHRQSAKAPAFSIQYTFKQPTADSRKGLGSGQRDHIVAMSAGKDFEGFSFAFETKYILFGKADSEPFSRRQEYSLEASHDLVRHLSLTGEIYGDTRSSTGEPGIVSSLWALSYSPKPRVIFDSGMDFGVTHGAPSKRFFAGVSYALGDVYKALRHQRP